MAKKIQDFREFNSSREEKTIVNKKSNVGVAANSAPKKSTRKNAGTGTASTRKNVGVGVNVRS